MKRQVGEEFYLKWKDEDLLGWEKEKIALDIAVLIEGIHLGCVLPCVDVVVESDGKYRLADTIKGGHNRAVARYITDTPLLCKLVEYIDRPLSDNRYFNIKDILLRDGGVVLPRHFGKLPIDVRIDFLWKNRSEFSSSRYWGRCFQDLTRLQ